MNGQICQMSSNNIRYCDEYQQHIMLKCIQYGCQIVQT